MTAEKYANEAGWSVYSYQASGSVFTAADTMKAATGVLVWRARGNQNVQSNDASMIRSSAELLNQIQQITGDSTICRLLSNSPVTSLRDDWATSAHTSKVEGDLGLDHTYEMYNYLMQPQREFSGKSVWIHSGCEAGDGITVEIDNMNTAILGIRDVDVSTVEGAEYAMEATKTAVQKISANRSKIGAQQNRLEHTIANEENIVENTTVAESRIRDTDMAGEMVKYSKDNILEQVGHAMMAQANQSNQGVLSLLV